MKSTVEKISPLGIKLNIQVPAPVVASTFENAFKDMQKKSHIKGFRPGKAPISTVKSIYGTNILQDVVQNLVQKHYYMALHEHKLIPIDHPEFEFNPPSENQDFSFSANFEVRPEINLKKYEGLEVEKEKIEITDEQVNNIIESIRASRSSSIDILEDRPAQNGDLAVINFEGFVDSKPLEGGSGTNHNLELGKKEFIEGFEEGVVGMKIGQQKTLSLKFPTTYHANLAGKDVEFKVTLNALKKKVLPDLDDAFAADVLSNRATENKTLGDLKKIIFNDIEQSEKRRIESDFRNRFLKVLVTANPVETPSSLLNEQKKLLTEDVKKKMTDQGMGEKEFSEYCQKWDKELETTASEMVQAGFIIDAIATKHDLHWTDEDLQKKYENLAKGMGVKAEDVRKWYEESDRSQQLTYAITEEKVLDFLLKSSQIKELSKDKLSDYI